MNDPERIYRYIKRRITDELTRVINHDDKKVRQHQSHHAPDENQRPHPDVPLQQRIEHYLFFCLEVSAKSYRNNDA